MPSSIPERLSALDASFLAVESPLAPMHVGWVASFDPPDGGPTDRRGADRPHRGAAWSTPTATARSWPTCRSASTTRCGSTTRTSIPRATSTRPTATSSTRCSPRRCRATARCGRCGSRATRRRSSARPTTAWSTALAVVELGNLLLDAEPGRARARDGGDWAPSPEPNPGQRLGRAIADRIGETAGLLATPLRLADATSGALPGHGAHGRPHAAAAGAAVAAEPARLRPPPPHARHAHARRGAHDPARLRRDAQRRRARRLRRRAAPLPRRAEAAQGHGPGRRALGRRPRRAATASRSCSSSCRSTSPTRSSASRPSTAPPTQRRRDEEAERLDDAFGVLALTPKPLQRTLAHAFAHPRLFNLTISSVPGPAVTRYLRGCRLRTVHSAVPLSAHHGLSIGVVTVAGNACFGISSDPATVPDADALAAPPRRRVRRTAGLGAPMPEVPLREAIAAMNIHAPSERNPKLAAFLAAANADTQLKARWHAAQVDGRAARDERPLVGAPADRAQPRAARVPAAAPEGRAVVDRDRLRARAARRRGGDRRRLPAARPRHVDPPGRPRGLQPVPRRRPPRHAAGRHLRGAGAHDRRLRDAARHHRPPQRRPAAHARGRHRARGRRARHGARPLARGRRDRTCRTSTRCRRRRSTRSGSCPARSARSASRSR